jgi:hypothetical protein
MQQRRFIMSVRTSSVLICVLSCLIAVSRPAAAGTELPMAAVPGDGVIRLTDYGHRDWGPEVLRYRVDTSRFRQGKLVLLDGEGKAVPFSARWRGQSRTVSDKGRRAHFRGWGREG